MYSALKVNGQKLCDLARKGKEVERQPREIEIFQLECLAFDGNTARLRVHCSKGTYIRTLCKDIGEALGCGGCMAALRRVTAGEYTIDEAVALETLLETDAPYMAPEPFRGKTNQSAYIKYTAEKIAALRGIDAQELIDICRENTRRLFGI